MKEVIKLRRKIKIWVICKSSYNAINNHSRINSSIDMHASLYVNIVLINTRLSIQVLRHLIYIYIYIYILPGYNFFTHTCTYWFGVHINKYKSIARER